MHITETMAVIPAHCDGITPNRYSKFTMPNKKTDKSKNKKNPKTQGRLARVLGWMNLNFHSQEEVDNTKRIEHKDNMRFVTGAILGVVSLAMLLSLLSHIFTGKEDQKLMTSHTMEATNWLGRTGYETAHWLMDNTFGVSSILIPILMLATSARIMNVVRHIRLHKWFLNCMVVMIWCSAFAALLTNMIPAAKESYINWGGVVGQQELEMLHHYVGPIGIILVLAISALLYTFYLSDEAISWIRRIVVPREKAKEDPALHPQVEADGDTAGQQVSSTIPEGQDEEDSTQQDQPPFEDEPSSTATTIDFNNLELDTEPPLRQGEQLLPLECSEGVEDMKVVVGKEPEKARPEEDGALEPYDPKLDLEYYKYPTLDLLKKYENRQSVVDMEEQEQNKKRILQILSNFNVQVSSIKATIGPTITLYELTPAPGVRINRIRGLEDDIALSLSALGIRIIAPIPGKGTIGIEVPNIRPQMVSMESILNSRKFQETDYELPMALGKTITNEVFMVDLAKMPHLLVAGATGQGKSVGLNAIITSLLYKKHPAELKLVMVDPKKVEFSVYNPIVNHFLAQVEGNEDNEEPIITDVNKVIQTLKSICLEMDTRYDLLKRARARNIKEYNQKFRDRQLNPQNGHRFMPYIVVVIDEFGDLIMTAGREIELPIARIAQLARAVGIHMIIATQRPTTNIITGTIKANFPARMAFKVSSMIDSRTILDRPGANQLVGKGDMLFLAGNEPVRVQCAFVDTPEVERITSFIASQQSYNAPFPLPEVPMEGGDDGGVADVDLNHLDPMFDEVARMVVTEQCGSTSMIQRKFSIGYNRAGRLMDQLEKAGIVGPARGSKPRDVLCTGDEELQYKLNNLR